MVIVKRTTQASFTKTVALSTVLATFTSITFSEHSYADASDSILSLHIGALNYSAKYRTDDPEFDNDDHSGSSTYAGISLHNQIKPKHALGAGLDIFKIEDMRLIGYRAIDYQWRFLEHWQAGAFIGAASLDSGLPQNGYYAGFNSSYHFWQDQFSLRLELKHGEGLARDKKLDDDPGKKPNPETPEIQPKPDMFLDFNSLGLQLSWHF